MSEKANSSDSGDTKPARQNVTIPDPERRAIIRKLAGLAASAVLVTVLLEEKSEAS